MESPINPLAAAILENQLSHAYPRLADAERARYAGLVDSIRKPGDVVVDAVPGGENQWTVTICSADFPGALSLIVGLLTAYRLDVLSADVQTLSFPETVVDKSPLRPATRRRLPSAQPTAPARRLVDRFEVRSLTRPAPDLWQAFRADFVGLIAAEHSEEARDEVIDRVSEVFRTLGSSDAKLLPLAIEISNAPAQRQTLVRVRSADTPGFLFAFANALADLAVNIERAEIRTVDGKAQDTFWVTDRWGHPIVDEKRLHELRVATTLIKQFTYLLPRSPNPGQALRQFKALISQMLSRPEWTTEFANLGTAAVLETLADLMGVSRFLWEDFLRLQHETLFPLLLDVPSLDGAQTKDALRDEVQKRLASRSSRAERVEELNAFKDLEMFRIDLRHITGRSDFAAFSQELTWLAEVAVEVAVELAQAELIPKLGKARLADGRSCPYCICALGKFGGGELGFGSDLELIFVYESQGNTDGPRPVFNSEYFERTVQIFLGTLKARQEGIFEIDLRLRPFGRAGALASSLDGFTAYYTLGGSAVQFERLTLVRLRPFAGDLELGKRIQKARDAFVYSGQSLDLENIHHLRHRQATELVPRGQVNAKYSHGGLVDLEYFVQAWQITVGSTNPTVRVTNTREAISRLANGGYLPHDLARELWETYDFLRQLIDALRVVRGHAKDLSIPTDQTREFSYLAHRLKFATTEQLREAIETRMAFAQGLWDGAGPSVRELTY